MITFPMPSHGPFADCGYHFVAGRSVSVFMTSSEDAQLSAAERYILETAGQCVGRECLEITYFFDPERWPEVVRLLVQTETEPLMAVFSCWMQFDPTGDVPPCMSAMKGGGD